MALPDQFEVTFSAWENYAKSANAVAQGNLYLCHLLPGFAEAWGEAIGTAQPDMQGYAATLGYDLCMRQVNLLRVQVARELKEKYHTREWPKVLSRVIFDTLKKAHHAPAP